MPVIDIHPHIVSPDTKRYPLAPLGGTQSTWSSERPTTYQTLLGAMDDAGIDKAAIVHSSTAYGYDNSYVAAAVAAVPSRFTAVCSIDVMAPDAVQTFDYWLGRGCTGMRLFTTGSTLPDQATWFVDPKTYPFWEHAAAKNIPVCMQMKQEGLPLLRQIMDRFPKVTMILDHLARAPFEDGPPYKAAAEFLELAKYKQVYLKITPVNVTPKNWGKGAPETFFGKIVDIFGASRIAWGSNFPNSVGPFFRDEYYIDELETYRGLRLKRKAEALAKRRAEHLAKQKKRARRFRTRNPGLHHGHRWNLAPRMHDGRRIPNRRAPAHRGIGRGLGPQGIFSASVFHRARVSALPTCPHGRRPNRRPILGEGQGDEKIIFETTTR